MLKKGRFLSLTMSIVMIIGASFLISCSSKEEKNVTEKKAENEYTEYFYTKDKTLMYRGYAEYGFDVDFKEKSEAKEKVMYKYGGRTNGSIGDVESFDVTYVVTEDKVVESVNKEGSYPKKNARVMEMNTAQTTELQVEVKEENKLLIGMENLYKDRLGSIINNFVVISGKIETGNKWKQSFEYEGKTYEGITEIVNVDKKGFETKTVVNNMEHYIGKQYVEERRYKKGLGLVGFNSSPYFQKLENIPSENKDGTYSDISYSLNEGIE